MGLISLYLKYAYTVPAYFYVHTDWMMFALKVLNFNQQNTDRLRRLLRAYYRGFDGLFVLNREQRRWLTGSSMGFDESKVFLTAHWAEADFIPRKSNKMEIFGVDEKTPVLLFAGRVSDEKGVMELPDIYEKISGLYPDARIAIAGTGPAEKKLRKALPGGIFLGWVEHDRLPEVYSAADMLLLPSRFDTFGCVVLEALSCGCPVAAYNTKGPRDIIEHGRSGYLVTNRHEMASCVKEYLGDAALRRRFRKAALKRAAKYDPGAITDRLLKDIELKATA
jgi:glycosyltransferase involved in cell wall biosynthesis